MGKLEVFKEEKAKHKWRKDKWNRWKKSQALLGKSRFINYKAWPVSLDESTWPDKLRNHSESRKDMYTVYNDRSTQK